MVELEYNDFSDDQITIIRTITQVFSSLSIASSVTMYLLFWFFKENRSFCLELIMWYSVSNLFRCMPAFFPYDPYKKMNWCAIQSFSITAFQQAASIWTCIIGYSGFITLIKNYHFEKYKNFYRILFFFISYGLSFSISSM